MSDEVSNDKIYGVLLDISRDIGEIKASASGTRDWLSTHVTDTKQQFDTTSKAIQTLQLAHARQRGFITAVIAVASAVGTAIGFFIQWWSHRT